MINSIIRQSEPLECRVSLFSFSFGWGRGGGGGGLEFRPWAFEGLGFLPLWLRLGVRSRLRDLLDPKS